MTKPGVYRGISLLIDGERKSYWIADSGGINRDRENLKGGQIFRCWEDALAAANARGAAYLEYHYELGWACGMAGEERRFEPDSPEHRSWLAGWDAFHAANRSSELNKTVRPVLSERLNGVGK